MTQAPTSHEATAARVRDVVATLVPGGPREVCSTDELVSDLGFDSLAMLELALALEVEFDLQAIPEDQAVSMITVGDIEALIAALVVEPPAEGQATSGS
ncbi:MAG TPA: phosphopantetheine-binding protein [Nocardioidaceae bacterium]|jgi:acyl carrier protein|nr:phosphopantetheine-binding protein [Nocardioidaceae bacterium]